MNKSELIDAIAKKAGLTKDAAAKAVNAYTDTVIEGFGTYEVKARAARIAHNPRTGAAIEIPATKVPAFKAGKGLKDAVK